MKFLGLCGVLLAAGLATGGAKAQDAAVKELIPTGKLRFGVAFAPKMSALFVVKDADGSPRGVTADLGNELAQRLGVPIEFMVAPNTGVLTDALASAAIDVAFMPVDEERKKRLEFGPAYCLVESTYMVTAASGIRTLAEVDRPGVRVVGIANTTTIRAAGRSLINTVPIAVTSIDDAVAMLRAVRRMPSHSGAIRCRRSSRNSPARTLSMADFSRPASRSRCRRATQKHSPM
jgi:polar amino acid transport system substrate-binding protein